ncbi:MAG: hypothetical protein ACD_4C00313G0002 [uncultured bacterium (gcode 4)]|uniref:DUF1360 domain-containing protein n=1 Tax=uncultured bacterium (gcode 4) TaxID=1234023 RepID=K2GSP7_9BACT|nr:MAG: hypothetical protein ACD_4C00313G0002 [uncultured bacterium (gcode 4)]
MLDKNYKWYYWHAFLFLFYIFLVLLSIIVFIKVDLVPIKISLADFFILSLATFRSTRLFVYDEVTNFIRDFFEKNNDSFSKSITELLKCPWCTSVWMALFLSFIYFISPYSWFFLLILALAWVSALIQVLFNFLSRYADKIKYDTKK